MEKLWTVDNMTLLGSTARNLGKTTMAIQLIEEYSQTSSVVAIKVVTVHSYEDHCPRGGRGCGICDKLKEPFDIQEETEDGTKDTMLFRKAGARVVYLVRSHPEALHSAMESVLSKTYPDDIIICESNSVRRVLKPGEFIMFRDPVQAIKASATAVLDLSDRIIDSK